MFLIHALVETDPLQRVVGKWPLIPGNFQEYSLVGLVEGLWPSAERISDDLAIAF